MGRPRGGGRVGIKYLQHHGVEAPGEDAGRVQRQQGRMQGARSLPAAAAGHGHQVDVRRRGGEEIATRAKGVLGATRAGGRGGAKVDAGGKVGGGR